MGNPDDAQRAGKIGGYLDYLPEIFRTDPWIENLLAAFERVLSGAEPNNPDGPIASWQQQLDKDGKGAFLGLEELIARIHRYFSSDPDCDKSAKNKRTPDDFLPWLANWVALSLEEDWDTEQKRRFISQIVSHYKWRGTKQGLRNMLQTYLPKAKIDIYEFDEPAHYFQVEITGKVPGTIKYSRWMAKKIIDQEKPAHTFYSLDTSNLKTG